jgi:CheY-like chemotaxis protein
LRQASYGQRVIYLIEDNQANADVIRGALAHRQQVTLVVIPRGRDGLAAMRQRRPSLVLLDMQLPDMHGVELLHALQCDPDSADIPVIVVSADAAQASIVAATRAGARRYLTKPVNVAQLLEALDELLEERDTYFGEL